MDQASVFSVIVPDREPFSDVLDLWQVGTAPRAFAFSGESQGLVWRADLPRDPQEARRALNRRAHLLRQTESALSAAGPLLDDDLRQLAESDRAGASYFLEPRGTESREAVLALGMNYDLQRMDFSGRGIGVLDLEEKMATVEQLAIQVRRLVEQFALVETSHGGHRSGLTRINWLGDAQTWWASDSPPTAIAHHNQLLRQVLGTRQNWLRFLLQLVAGAAKIGMAMASGPFAPIAIWTAFNYLRKVMEQYRRLAVPAGS
jgi:hypothetical protein